MAIPGKMPWQMLSTKLSYFEMRSFDSNRERARNLRKTLLALRLGNLTPRQSAGVGAPADYFLSPNEVNADFEIDDDADANADDGKRRPARNTAPSDDDAPLVAPPYSESSAVSAESKRQKMVRERRERNRVSATRSNSERAERLKVTRSELGKAKATVETLLRRQADLREQNNQLRARLLEHYSGIRVRLGFHIHGYETHAQMCVKKTVPS